VSGCGAPVGGAATTGLNLGNESVIEGTVARADSPVTGAYVRLLDTSGEFTAEVPSEAYGSFRFFARPGDWTLRTLAPRAGSVDTDVTARQGEVVRVDVRV
jgi:hypothetical protein